MIRNLAAYAAWKRSTLDRVTAKYRRLFASVILRHIARQEAAMMHALEAGHTVFPVSTAGLENEFTVILQQHQSNVVKVGVSDGMREVDPEKNLSSWERWPYWYPVENTFVDLAERKLRDSIYTRIEKALQKKHTTTIAKVVDFQKKRYLRLVKFTFQVAAEGYLKEEEGTTPKEVVKDIIKSVFKKSEVQAEMIFRTETTRYFNEARIGYFKNDTDVDFIRLVTITDSRVSDICEARHNYVVPLSRSGEKQYKPPFHPNCRTVSSPLVSILKSAQKTIEENLGSEFGTIHSDTSNKDFKGRRSAPRVGLPKGWG